MWALNGNVQTIFRQLQQKAIRYKLYICCETNKLETSIALDIILVLGCHL